MITIDKLRKVAVRRAHYMGLGVIKVITTYGSYRFYCKELIPQTADQHHSHTYSFESVIQRGTLLNIIYDVKPVDYETDYMLTQGKCLKGNVPETIAENVAVTETIRFENTAGSKYSLDSQVFHRIEHVTPCIITLCNRIAPAPVPPSFVVDKRFPPPDAWQYKKTPQECWEIVEHVITSTDN